MKQISLVHILSIKLTLAYELDPNCQCFSNSKDDIDLCENEDYDIARCYSFVDKDGNYKCHWGPEEIYTCWRQGFD